MYIHFIKMLKSHVRCCVNETSFITGQVPDVHTDIKASGTSRFI